ncbi:hypothetical protein FRZ44_37990 [Hypericibacter terrae]|uniref:Phage tail assembly chaperone n=1 Tax=Hypericibacter terrae TaxID=2602015 RepID=A0A5J6MLL5_9PROT|nr:hypothetical protein FRZ44_37990 [Hypericibacter terrae]
MGWRPADFWAATPHEFFAALDGHAAANGRGDKGESEAEFASFKAKLEAKGLA